MQSCESSVFSHRAVASVGQGGQMPPSRNFGPEVQYSDIFLEKNYVFFIVILNEKVLFSVK